MTRFRPLLIALFAMSVPSLAFADPPVCAPTVGGYSVTVSGNSVTVCPTAPPAASTGISPTIDPSWGCPLNVLGFTRVDLATGDETLLPLNACVPAPDDAGSSSTTCYQDDCVPPGTYAYGYTAPLWGTDSINACEGTCVGPRHEVEAVEVTVTNALSSCTPEFGDAAVNPFPPPLGWPLDAGAIDGSFDFERTCCPETPGPDGGQCAVEDTDCSIYWGDCSPDGGALCLWYQSDGGPIALPCEDPADAGEFNGGGTLSTDGGADASRPVTPLPDAGDRDSSVDGPQPIIVDSDAGDRSAIPGDSVPPTKSGSCAISTGPSTETPATALFAIALIAGASLARKRRDERAL